MDATRDIFRGVSSIRFYNRFKTDEDCYQYLAAIKWLDDRYVCKRCGTTNYCKGKKPYSRRCTRCKHDESVTAGTMFDKLKFPLLSAFQVHVDEFYIGGEEEDVFGRKPNSKKKLVVVALVLLEDSNNSDVGRVCAEVIDNASASSFRPFFERHISKRAHVVTDERNGYKPLAKDYDLEQRKSEN